MPVTQHLQNIWQRFKKLFLLLILIPILTAVVSYIVEAKQSAVYDGIAKIELGEFDEPSFTKQANAKHYIFRPAFLEEVTSGNEDVLPAEEIAEKLDITGEGENIILLELSGTDRAAVQNTLSAVTQLFVAQSEEAYETKTEFIRNKIDDVQNQSVSSEEVVDKEKFLYDLQTALMKMRETVLLQDVELTANEPNPILRAGMGFVIGVVLSCLLLVVPELLREEHAS